MKTKNKRFDFRRNFIWNLIGTTCWSLLSLILMVVVARLNNAEDAGIYSFAFSTAAVFMAIGAYSGRTFQITDKNPKTTDSDYFHLKFITCGAMLVVALVFSYIRGYDFSKLLVLLTLTFFRALEAFCESVNAVLQKQTRLDQVGKSFFFKSLLAIGIFVAVDLLTHNILLSCLALVVASLSVIAFYDLRNLRHLDFRLLPPNRHHVWLLFRIGFFVFGFSFLNLYLINAARYALDTTCSDDVQLIYGIIAMPATALGLFGQYLIQPFLVPLKKACFTDFAKFQALTYKIILLVCGCGLLCLAAAWIAGIPVLELIYSLELDSHLGALLLIIIGGTFATIVAVLSTSLTTMRRTAPQLLIYVIVSLLALCISRPLVLVAGIFGACLSYLISMGALCLLYFALFIYQCCKFRQNLTEEAHRATQE